MQDPAHAHIHQVLVLGEDRRHAIPGLVGGVRRHPVDAVFGEEIDPVLPALGVQQLGLPVEELLYLMLKRQVLLHACMYCAHAFIWLRIGASDVPMLGPLSTTPFFSMSRPKWRPKVTQSPPSEARPVWHFQKFSRSS